MIPFDLRYLAEFSFEVLKREHELSALISYDVYYYIKKFKIVLGLKYLLQDKLHLRNGKFVMFNLTGKSHGQ
jgi:hypothetical protein